MDPLEQCTDAGAASCGNNGACDGAGACRTYPAGTQCEMASCTAATYSAPRTCNGSGMCQPAETTSCDTYQCGPTGTCLTMCMTSADCVPPNVCNSGVCSKKTLGTACTSGTECASGLCQQGVCCSSSCTGGCQSCALAGTLGMCRPVPAGDDPLDSCTDAGAATCGNDGACDGAGSCRRYAAGTECLPRDCTGSTETSARTCDGSGVCRPPTTRQCDPYVCNTTTDMCRDTCSGPADCVPPSTCAGMSCGKLPNSAPCTMGAMCNSGFCSQGVCCDLDCSGTCQSCNLMGTAGQCRAVPAGQDPLMQCADQGAASCGFDGFCNGSGACRLQASGTVCRMSTGVCDPAETCNGMTPMCPADTGSAAPPVPTGLVATAGNAQVSLTWNASTGATGYVVRRATTSGGPYTTVGTPATPSFVDMSLTNGTTYFYVVAATSLSGACVSGNSTQVSAMPSPCAGAVYCDNFEAGTIGSLPAGWTRVGGSMGDWNVVMAADAANMTKVLAQNTSVSLTPRFVFASGGSPAAPWSGAPSITADVKLMALGMSGQAARVCLRYADLSNHYCLQVLTSPGSGAIQILSRVAGVNSTSPTWATPVSVGTWLKVKLSISAAGAISAYVGTTLLGTFTPPTTLSSGFAALGTASAQAAFDNVVVTQP
jgi:hypothetical protein